MRRAHEMHRLPAIGELIAHHLGNRQAGQRLIERALQGGCETRARQGEIEIERGVLDLARLTQLGHANALCALHAQGGELLL